MNNFNQITMCRERTKLQHKQKQHPQRLGKKIINFFLGLSDDKLKKVFKIKHD